MSHTQVEVPMKGASNQPTFSAHLELHAAVLNVLGVGARIPRAKFNAFIMERTGVGLRQSVQRYLEAWEDLGLIEPGTWKGRKNRPGEVVIRAPPPGLALPQLPAVAVPA